MGSTYYLLAEEYNRLTFANNVMFHNWKIISMQHQGEEIWSCEITRRDSIREHNKLLYFKKMFSF